MGEIASVLELKEAGEGSCGHTAALLERHLAEIDDQIERLRSARVALNELAMRARSLDPAACTDPNRCQVIEESHPRDVSETSRHPSTLQLSGISIVEV